VTVPAATARLFSEPRLEELVADGNWDPVVRRLLEDGDRRDLHWLISALGEERLVAWFERWGERRLSERSRAFWSMLWQSPRTGTQMDRPRIWPH